MGIALVAHKQSAVSTGSEDPNHRGQTARVKSVHLEATESKSTINWFRTRFEWAICNPAAFANVTNSPACELPLKQFDVLIVLSFAKRKNIEMFVSTAFKFLFVVLIFLLVFNPISIFGQNKDTSLSHHQGKSLINNAHDLDTAAFTLYRKKKKKKGEMSYEPGNCLRGTSGFIRTRPTSWSDLQTWNYPHSI